MGITVSVCTSDKTLCALDRSDEAREDEANATQFSLNVLDKAFSGHGDKTFDSLLSVITEEPTVLSTDDATAKIDTLLSPNHELRRFALEDVLHKQLFKDIGNETTDPDLAALYTAISKNSEAGIKQWYEGHPDAKVVFANGLTPLHLAVSSGCLPVLALLLKTNVAEITAVDCLNRNALHYAYSMGRSDLVEILLMHDGGDAFGAANLPHVETSVVITQRDCYGNTPLDLDSTPRIRSDSSLTSSTFLPIGSPLADDTSSVSTDGAPFATSYKYGLAFKSPKVRGRGHISRSFRKGASFVLASVLPARVYQQKGKRDRVTGQTGSDIESIKGSLSAKLDSHIGGGSFVPLPSASSSLVFQIPSSALPSSPPSPAALPSGESERGACLWVDFPSKAKSGNGECSGYTDHATEDSSSLGVGKNELSVN